MVMLLCWDLLFWESKPGVNILIFLFLLVAGIFASRPKECLNPSALGMAAMTLMAAAMLVLQNSALSLVLSLLYFLTFLGFSMERRLRLGWYAGLTAAINYIKMPSGILKRIQERTKGRKGAGAFIRLLKLAVVPIAVAMVFLFIYKGANPKFDTLTAGMFGWIGEYLNAVMKEIFSARVIFLFFGLVFILGALFRFKPREALGWEQGYKERLAPSNDMEGRRVKLQERFRMGVVLLLLVNAILLVVNFIDIQWIWLGFEVPEGFSLKGFVHEGTWLLILSIVLSMAVLFVLFHSDQNFFHPSGWLHKLAYLWIAQNLILGCSVFLRNYHYISFHGLAYKRIGVVVFLILVLIGLATMFIKVRNRRTVFYILRINSWAAAVVLCLVSMVNWDRTIARYNLGHSNPAEIDVDNYLELSPRVLPMIYANLDVVERQMEKHRNNKVQWIDHRDMTSFRAELDKRRDRFLQSRAQYGWNSWTWAEQRTHDELLAMGLLTEEHAQ